MIAGQSEQFVHVTLYDREFKTTREFIFPTWARVSPVVENMLFASTWQW